MQSGIKTYINRFVKDKNRRLRMTALLCVLALLVTAGVSWQLRLTGITMTNEEACCGKAEHTHTEECIGEKILICGYEEDAAPIEQPTVESDSALPLAAHTHTDSCYCAEQILACDKGHTHTAECYAEESVLTCTDESAEHVHSNGCYTVQTTLICGCEKHEHSESCYTVENTLVCEAATSTHEPALEIHTHTDACYQVAYSCGIEEHTHTLECYSDPKADLETSGDWEATLPGQLTGVWADDLLAVAASQLGYQESERNFKVSEDGETVKGYTRYGEWYGNAYGDWCAMFVSFCLHYAGIPQEAIPYAAGCYAWSVALDELGLYKQAADYTPAPGDIVFFNNDGNGRAGHVGIVKELFTQTDPQTGAETALLRTIEGNTSGMVREHEYTLTDSLLLGYGSLAAAYARAVELGLVEPVAYIVSDELQALLDQFSAEAAASEAASDEDLTAALDRMLALYSQAESLFLQLNADAQEGAFASWMAQQYPDAYATYSSLLENSALINPEEIAERAVGTNWITLRDSGYFEYWSNTSEESRPAALKTASSRSSLSASAQSTGDPSDVQIREEGGSAASDDGAVTVSKTIDGTDIENVFDITLQVQTQTNISEFYEELDMAVVIVMDISNTMKENFSGTTTRYAAAMEAAENFIDQFTASSAGVSKIGYVAFNTDAYEIFGLQNCSTETKAVSLKNTMRTKTGNIINATGYGKSHTRFTNIEAGLKMAQDMLAKAGNRNKYIIFLSDGFPTTYVMNGYTGYDPYMDSNNRNGITSVPGDKIGKDGYFYDKVSKKPCTYGTSYSDKAAIRARSMATAIKNAGIKIFSIGVDIGSQTIQDYINAQGTSFSVVDRTSGTYEIGSANSRTAYVNWLKGSGTSNTVGIGSGYYYDSTSHQELTNAYQQIFAEIQRLRKESSQIVWVSEDPLPISENNHETVEFIGFYNQQNVLTPGQLTGSNTLNGENTAAFTGQNIIRWDLKQSGYTSTSSGSTTVYTYTLVYRVRLKNEDAAFAERGYYPTNDRTTLQYQTLESINEVVSISDPKTIDFPIPAVEGYLSAFSFKKLDNFGRPVAGAEFTLTHDVQNCNRCRGDETSVSIQSFVAYSDADGTVSFANIPSGHQYTLTETVVPTGYQPSGESYQVTVDYDSISLTVMHADGATSTWVMDGTDVIVNATGYELPATGGSGTLLYTIGGLLLVAVPLVYGCSRRRKRERGPV